MFLTSLALQILFMMPPSSSSTVAAAATTPHVAIAGAGPAGLLSAILLSQAGVSVTVLEKSLVADPWSTKSYSINLNPRGLGALEHAGVLEAVQAVGMERRQIVLESRDGTQQRIPKNPSNYALTRPALVECLEEIVKTKHADRITIQRGVEVKHIAIATSSSSAAAADDDDDDGDVENDDTNGTLVVTLDNGSSIACTHVIGADGKWSATRNSVADWKDQFQVQPEPAFGVSITPTVTPVRWQQDATTVFRPKSPKYYIIAAPLPDGQFSVSAVCFDEIQEDHPWLVPQDQQQEQNMDWEAEYGARTSSTMKDEALSEKMAELLREDLPLFYEDIRGHESLSNNVRINRRTSWLKPLSDHPRYCDSTGRVALVGDAAHAMTPSVGEGCNCALESAVCLLQSLPPPPDQQEQTGKQPQPLTVDALTKAFLDYGITRPPQVLPIQLRSAASNRYKVPETMPP